MLFLFEFIIDGLTADVVDQVILDGKLVMKLNSGIIQTERHFMKWSRQVSRSLEKEKPPEIAYTRDFQVNALSNAGESERVYQK